MNDVEKKLRKNIGMKIKLARTKSEFTQEQLAEKIDLVDQSFLENYLKLNDYNQTIIEAITKELVKIQKEDEGKETIKEHA